MGLFRRASDGVPPLIDIPKVSELPPAKLNSAARYLGTIDVIAPDHAPHPHEDKDCEWAAAAFGMLGLETALSIVQETMVDTGRLDWAGVADRMSVAPARIGRLAGHGRPIAEGEPANLALVHPAYRGTVNPAGFASRSRNTPYEGRELPGKVFATLLRGHGTVMDGKLT